MNLSFSTLSCPDWTWQKILKEARVNGYQGIEVRGINGEMYLPNAEQFSDENILETIDELKKQGLTITDIGSSVKFHEPETYEENIVEGKEYIELAYRLGVPYIRVFGNKILNMAQKEDSINKVIQGITDLCQYAEDKGVSCLLETHGDFVNLKTLVPVIKGITCKNFGIIWDVAHTFEVYGGEVTEFLEIMSPYIKHVHIKDLKKTETGYDLCMIGEGDIHLSRIVTDLKAMGYDGYLSLEWEKKWVPELEDPEFVIPLYAKIMKTLI